MSTLSSFKKILGTEADAIPIFHGSDCTLHPEDFDFARADADSDFGKAVYFGTSFNQANRWALRHGNGIVNCYILSIDKLVHDDLSISILEDRLDWLNIILLFIDNVSIEHYDVIVGYTMDGHTGWIIQKYMRLADSLGIRMVDLGLDIKLRMIEELKPDRLGKQIAFKTEKGLKHIDFIGSIGAVEMTVSKHRDPSETAATVAMLISQEDGIELNHALACFMRSNTFRRLVDDVDLVDAEPSEILELYRNEVS